MSDVNEEIPTETVSVASTAVPTAGTPSISELSIFEVKLFQNSVEITDYIISNRRALRVEGSCSPPVCTIRASFMGTTVADQTTTSAAGAWSLEFPQADMSKLASGASVRLQVTARHPNFQSGPSTFLVGVVYVNLTVS